MYRYRLGSVLAAIGCKISWAHSHWSTVITRHNSKPPTAGVLCDDRRPVLLAPIVVSQQLHALGASQLVTGADDDVFSRIALPGCLFMWTRPGCIKIQQGRTTCPPVDLKPCGHGVCYGVMAWWDKALSADTMYC
jgi:hypothetical protein